MRFRAVDAHAASLAEHHAHMIGNQDIVIWILMLVLFCALVMALILARRVFGACPMDGKKRA